MSGLAKEVKNSTKTTRFPPSLLLLEGGGGSRSRSAVLLLLLLVELLLVAVVVGEAVATVAASEMAVELVVLQGSTTILLKYVFHDTILLSTVLMRPLQARGLRAFLER